MMRFSSIFQFLHRIPRVEFDHILYGPVLIELDESYHKRVIKTVLRLCFGDGVFDIGVGERKMYDIPDDVVKTTLFISAIIRENNLSAFGGFRREFAKIEEKFKNGPVQEYLNMMKRLAYFYETKRALRSL